MMNESSMSSQKKSVLSIIALLVLAAGAALLLSNKNSAEPTNTPVVSETKTIRADLVVDGNTYTAEIAEGGSLLALMENAQSETDFSFGGETSEGIGFFVNEINGVKSSTEENKFWLYYINGEPAMTGAQDYTVQAGDRIEWRYEGF